MSVVNWGVTRNAAKEGIKPSTLLGSGAYCGKVGMVRFPLPSLISSCDGAVSGRLHPLAARHSTPSQPQHLERASVLPAFCSFDPVPLLHWPHAYSKHDDAVRFDKMVCPNRLDMPKLAERRWLAPKYPITSTVEPMCPCGLATRLCCV